MSEFRHETGPKPAVVPIEHGNGLILVELPPGITSAEDAFALWKNAGGQPRTFGENIDIDTLDFSDWLLLQPGVQVIE